MSDQMKGILIVCAGQLIIIALIPILKFLGF